MPAGERRRGGKKGGAAHAKVDDSVFFRGHKTNLFWDIGAQCLSDNVYPFYYDYDIHASSNTKMINFGRLIGGTVEISYISKIVNSPSPYLACGQPSARHGWLPAIWIECGLRQPMAVESGRSRPDVAEQLANSRSGRPRSQIWWLRGQAAGWPCVCVGWGGGGDGRRLGMAVGANDLGCSIKLDLAQR